MLELRKEMSEVKTSLAQLNQSSAALQERSCMCILPSCAHRLYSRRKNGLSNLPTHTLAFLASFHSVTSRRRKWRESRRF